MSAPYPTYEEEEAVMYREEEHDAVYPLCRRCSNPVSEDDAVQGLCPDCMVEAGLVKCDYCGRAFAKSISKVDGVFNYCPPCVRMIAKGVV